MWQYFSIVAGVDLALNRLYHNCRYLCNEEPIHWSILKSNWVNALRPIQNGCHIADCMLKSIFLNPIAVFLLKFPRNLFQSVQSTITHLIDSANGLIPIKCQAIFGLNDGLVTDAYMRHSASMS